MHTDEHKLTDVLVLLAGGEFCSGERLGQVLGISRAAVWKRLQALAPLGVTIECVRGKGYRIPGGIDLLQQGALRAALSPKSAKALQFIELHTIIDSTSALLKRRLAAAGNQKITGACLAEMQTAGQGRRGRTWQSPFACNIYMSMLWPFSGGVAAMAGLSLAIGVALVEALAALGIEGVQLKWPNDVVVGDAKLAGVLIEVSGDAAGDCHAIVGVGLNVQVPAQVMQSVDQPWTDIASVAKSCPARSLLCAALLNAFVDVLESYELTGFAPYRDRWQALNAHQGRRVALLSGAARIEGRVEGLGAQGGLMLMLDDGEVREFVGGELSLRGCAS